VYQGGQTDGGGESDRMFKPSANVSIVGPAIGWKSERILTVSRSGSFRCRIGISDRVGNPQSAAVVERQIQRLVDLRLEATS
jgi:hypothetical protein